MFDFAHCAIVRQPPCLLRRPMAHFCVKSLKSFAPTPHAPWVRYLRQTPCQVIEIICAIVRAPTPYILRIYPGTSLEVSSRDRVRYV